ncbi:MAG TPA: FAD/NAD(P)-binding protein [Solirubrobacterales bacterium]|nr:FAD/NAD(P)-binding protein [Solirubrobacterales bacterium]
MSAAVAARRDPLLPDRFRVTGRTRETADTWTLTLEPVDRDPLAFAPGQFNMVYAFGAGEVPISISGDPGRAGPLVHTVRAVGKATAAICDAQEGAMLGVRGPFGTDWPLAAAEGRDVVVVAGGVGLAPVRPIVYAVLAQPDRFGRALVLYGGRQPDQLLYSAELAAWREQGIDVDVTVDIATSSWTGKVGVVPQLIGRAALDPERAVAFVCGPEAMMRFSAEALLERGLRPEHVYVSMERNMKCAVGQCGHCQLGPEFVCRDGAVFSWPRIRHAFRIREI